MLSKVFFLFIFSLNFLSLSYAKEIKIQGCQYQFYLKDGKEVKHGPYQLHNASGNVILKGKYEHGTKDGLWQTWYPNGIEKRREHHKMGMLEKELQTWHSNGNKASLTLFVAGRKHGLIETWHDNGNLKSKSDWKHGRQHGESIEWHKNKSKKLEEHYLEGKRHGTFLEWDPEGKLVSQKTFQHGKELIILIKQEKYSNGHMKYAYSYYVDEKEQEIKHGKYQKWFPNGEPWIKCSYWYDKLHGLWQYGKKEGTHCRQEFYRYGKKHGEFLWWQQGEIVKKEIWIKGKLLQQQIY